MGSICLYLFTFRRCVLHLTSGGCSDINPVSNMPSLGDQSATGIVSGRQYELQTDSQTEERTTELTEEAPPSIVSTDLPTTIISHLTASQNLLSAPHGSELTRRTYLFVRPRPSLPTRNIEEEARVW